MSKTPTYEAWCDMKRRCDNRRRKEMRTAKGFTYGYTEDVEAIDPRLKDYRDQEWEAEKRRAWVAFASAEMLAISMMSKEQGGGYPATSGYYADLLLKEFEKRFKEEGQ